jgi:hypothetical protein
MTLGQQFDRIMQSRIESLTVKAGYPIAEEIAERMKQNTKEGHSFGNERYDTPYQRRYARKRTRDGLQTSRVDLRTRNLRIERTTAPVTQFSGGTAGAEIGFVDGGRIFKYHQDGITYRNGLHRMRTIFPRSWESVPADIYERFKTLIVEVLSGRK